MASGSTGGRTSGEWGRAISEAVVGSLKTSLTDEGNSVRKGLEQAEKIVPKSPPIWTPSSEDDTGSPVPGVVAVVYEEFFNKGSAVAVKLLQACTAIHDKQFPLTEQKSFLTLKL